MPMATHLSQQMPKHDFCINLKEAWNMVFKLLEGFQNHHKVFIPKKSNQNVERSQNLMKKMPTS
jgi:hypothetical protein